MNEATSHLKSLQILKGIIEFPNEDGPVIADNLFQVSWIRKRDLHILTAGIFTYTSDQRFQVIRPEKSDNWTLQIRFPQLRDSGVYECQVNTEPKMSLPFRLNVVGK